MMRGKFPPVRVLLLVAGCVLVSACAGTSHTTYAVKDGQGNQEGGGYKIGKPYQIGGVWYYPAEDYSYEETGIASWYGPDFHGKFTANGEVFDQNDVTAAHRTLPLPSFVRVTNLDNGRSLVVRVNDRGPFAHSRIIDLSRRSAQLLGIEQQGTARVKVEIMAEESKALAMRLKSKSEEGQVAAAPRETVQAETLPAPGSSEQAKPIVNTAPAPRPQVTPPDAQQLASQPVKVVAVKSTQMYIQAGAFSRFDNANRMSAALSGMGKTTITQVATKAGTMFRVRLGPLTNLDAADAMLEKVIASGYPEAKIVVD
ncbi:septal ring lytic transglycosylase RlpA family protein [Telmatospirillum sp.]|uniref:septal ring lytic transglycosylase RlpA family protein n=1 Tax=Telmatospirillum sp. TaxID=2079197 RepID=UPI0028430C01|nr:septal ring lytic transglycosylase RlpA family protein [Telmatospirillum sp.]MDR3435460.1 septal ring lytic transglycosylase RlpA family protein [Telmatospirillum sp.]